MTELQRPICSELCARLIFQAGGFEMDMEFHRLRRAEIKRAIGSPPGEARGYYRPFAGQKDWSPSPI
jgi:hypothetical protein